MKYKFECNVCGKLTSGRVPKEGDGSFVFPRRHKVKGKDCPGNIKEARWVEIENK
jgi:hypothetical protein